MKSKFQNLDFGSVEVLSQEQQNKVKGGYFTYGQAGGVSIIPNTGPMPYNCVCVVIGAILGGVAPYPTVITASSCQEAKTQCFDYCDTFGAAGIKKMC
jgi:hypothetical protein